MVLYLRAVWRADGNASVGHNATRDVRANRVPERAPMMAFAVGLDSVQFQMNKMRHGAEMVLTRRACMGFQEGAVEPRPHVPANGVHRAAHRVEGVVGVPLQR